MRSVALSRLIFAERSVAPIRADRDHVLRLADGRSLGVAEFGARAAMPVLYLHGFCGSRLEPGAIEGRRINIIAFDRPGYGSSDLQPTPSLAAFGRDVREGLDLLGVERCVVVGASAGAPYAVAAALALGRRATRLALVGGIATPEVLLGAGGAARVIVRLARHTRSGRFLHRWLRFARWTGLDRTLLGIAVASESAPLARSGVEPAVVHERLLQSLRTGSDRWLRGVAADAHLLAQPWDIDHRALAVPTLVRHGTKDRAVPVAHARWYAGHLPGARLELLPGEHHLSLCFASVPSIERLAAEAAAR